MDPNSDNQLDDERDGKSDPAVRKWPTNCTDGTHSTNCRNHEHYVREMFSYQQDFARKWMNSFITDRQIQSRVSINLAVAEKYFSTV